MISLQGGIGNIIQAVPFLSYLKREGGQDLALRLLDYEEVPEDMQRLLSPLSDCILGREQGSPPDVGKGLWGKYTKADRRKFSEWEAWFRFHGVEPPLPKDVEFNIYHSEMPQCHKLVLSPTGREGWVMKRWPYWQQLIDRFPGCAVVGNTSDGGPLYGDFEDYRGKLDLCQLGGILSNAECVVSHDSGPGHLAAACGAKTIILFGGTHIPKNVPPRNAIPMSPKEPMDCYPCQYKGWVEKDNIVHGCRKEDMIAGYSRCMVDISPSSVIHEIEAEMTPLEIVVVTAIAGGSDTLKEPMAKSRRCRYVCFTDGEWPESSWGILPLPDYECPRRVSREIKMTAQERFPDANYIVWVDASFRLKVELTAEFLDELLSGADLATYKHPRRGDVYQEAALCIREGKDDPQTIKKQMRRYREDGLKEDSGLHETGITVWKPTAKTAEFFRGWKSEIDRGSLRDQLSFDYCRLKTGLEVSHIKGEVRNSPYWNCYDHHPKEQIDVIIVDAPGVYSDENREHLNRLVRKLEEDERLVVTVGLNPNNKKGLPKTRNEIFKRTTQKYVCFMDFDFDLDTFSIDWNAATDVLDEGDVGVVMPKVKGSGFVGDGQFPSVMKDTCHVMIMRRDVADKLGPFDESYLVASADWDLMRRVWGMGLRVIQHNGSHVVHLGFSESVTDKRSIWKKDRQTYRNKWGGKTWECAPSVLNDNPEDGFFAIYDKHGDHVRPWLAGLVAYLQKTSVVRVFAGSHFSNHSAGGDCTPLIKDRDFWLKELEGCRHVIMWNGDCVPCHTIKAVCAEKGIPWSVVEVAWLPQSKYWCIDTEGINANSSLMHDDLSWVGEEQHRKLAALKKEFCKGKKWNKPGQFMLFPLQVEGDSNVVLHSPFATMQAFINHCQKKFKGRRLVFKTHPKENRPYRGNGRSELVKKGSFLDIAQNARRVYGVNSTSLLEAAMLGIPVEAVGEGFVKAHGHQMDKLLAALADKQIPVGESDLDYWMKPILTKHPHFPVPEVEVPRNRRVEFVTAAYRIDDETVGKFIGRNRAAFEKFGVKLLIVTDRPLDFLPSWARCVIYPEVEVMALTSMINYGIRRSSAEIVAKTDIDIILSEEAIGHVNMVTQGHGVTGLPAYVSEEKIGKKPWQMMEKRDRHYGACLAMHRGDWYRIQGYNENIIGWGADDEEIVARAQIMMDFKVLDIGPLYHIVHPFRRGTDFWPNRCAANRGSLWPRDIINHQPVYDGILVPKDDSEWDVEKDAQLQAKVI